jgi:mRNA interferase RelE/StbE
VSDRYSLEWRPSARKELKRLDKSVAARIVRKVNELADDPRPAGVIRLTGADLWRVRVGDYRVVYAIEDDQLVVLIVRVGGRGAVYRDI